MRKFKLFTLMVILLTFILPSCTIQKRLYMTGYNVEWRNGIQKKNKQVTNDNNINYTSVIENENNAKPLANLIQAKTLNADNIKTDDDNLLASADNSIYIPSDPKIDNSNKNIFPEIENNKLTPSKVRTVFKAAKRQARKADPSSEQAPLWLLFILCIFIPPLAVGLATNWDWTRVIYNILWCLLCWLPGIIHAFIIVSKVR